MLCVDLGFRHTRCDDILRFSHVNEWGGILHSFTFDFMLLVQPPLNAYLSPVQIKSEYPKWTRVPIRQSRPTAGTKVEQKLTGVPYQGRMPLCLNKIPSRKFVNSQTVNRQSDVRREGPHFTAPFGCNQRKRNKVFLNRSAR